MKQRSFTDMELSLQKWKSRQKAFLDDMEKGGVARPDRHHEPPYSKADNGRRPMSLAMMQRIHCAQKKCNLSDVGMESELYECMALRAVSQSVIKPVKAVRASELGGSNLFQVTEAEVEAEADLERRRAALPAAVQAGQRVREPA